MSERLNNRTSPYLGQVVAGVITAVDPTNGTCRVATADLGLDIEGCVWLTQSFTAPILGYRIKAMPSVDTGVILLIGSPSFIIGVFDTPDYDTSFGLSLTKDGSFAREKYFKDNLYPGYEGSASLLEGEFEIENAFNVGMSFLTNIVSLGAGARAKIEAHLLNDMVRIIAEEYRSITPLGEISIFDDGRPNMEIKFGNSVQELLNKKGIPISDSGVNLDTLESNQEEIWGSTNDSIGHRFKTYIGFVGNFLNMFVSDPANSLNSIVSGKAQFHIGNSGDILLRTVSEIALERVVRILVPAKIPGPLSKEPDFEANQDRFLKLWKYGTGSENKIHQCAYSLREYARYLSNHVSLMRFHQMELYDIPKESEVPAPDMFNREDDLAAVNNETPTFIEGYSTIRIFRDGSVLSMDNYGGSVYHGRGFVEISAVKDIRLDSARDISFVAGRNIFLKAKKNIEISSIEGGIVAKSRELINILCELGKIWIKSDAQDSESTEDNPDSVSADFGIVLDSVRSKFFINSKKNMIIQQEEGNLYIDSKKGNTFLDADQNVVIRSKNADLLIDVKSQIIAKCKNVFFRCRNFNIANKLFVNSGNFIVKLKTFIQRKLQVYQDIYGPPVEIAHTVLVPNCCAGIGELDGTVPGTYNHIKEIGNQQFPEFENGTTNILQDKITNLVEEFAESSKSFEKDMWKFQNNNVFIIASGSKDSTFLPHAQDFLETTQDPTFTDYIEWTFGKDDKLKEAPRTDTTSFPYPGEEEPKENHMSFSSGENLNKPANKDSFEWEAKELETRTIRRKVSK